MIAQADAMRMPLADESVDCCVCSPPYWGLRDYGLATWEGGDAECDHKVGRFEYAVSEKQISNSGSGGHQARTVCPKCGAVRHEPGIGLEPTLEAYIENMVAVFREVWRVLRDDGTLWLNLGDVYNSGTSADRNPSGNAGGDGYGKHGYWTNPHIAKRVNAVALKPKDLVGIPWRVAFALQADGWYLRSDIIWHKPNPMPESVTDRPTKAHEYLFLLTKSARYYYDAEAIAEDAKPEHFSRYDYPVNVGAKEMAGAGRPNRASNTPGIKRLITRRNRRTVWTIPTHPYRGAHFATFPPALVEPCILAGTSAKGNCPVCGKAWGRTTEKVRTFESGSGRAGNLPVGKHGPNMQGGGETLDIRRGPVLHTSMTGWHPPCDHDAEPVPAIVLDPFCGSGTVGQVCRLHGRRFVGLDLSMKYLRDLALPRAKQKQAAAAIEAMPLFGGEA